MSQESEKTIQKDERWADLPEEQRQRLVRYEEEAKEDESEIRKEFEKLIEAATVEEEKSKIRAEMQRRLNLTEENLAKLIFNALEKPW